MYFCYILLCADNSYYIVVTDNPSERTQRHNEGRGANWTASRRPVSLVWTEEHPTLSAARTHENQLKRWSRGKKDALVKGSLPSRSGEAA
jgi:putative endonuclease